MKKNIFKKISVVISLLVTISIMFISCSSNTNDVSQNESEVVINSSTDSESSNNYLRLGIGIGTNGPVYNATIYNNDTGKYLLSQITGNTMLLPSSYDQDGVLKYYDMPRNAPTNPEEIEDVKAGEILLDGGDRLLLFYEDTNYSGNFTKVGYIEDVSGFASSVGTGNVQFLMDKNPN